MTLADGTKLPYDRLVVAPGIDIRWDALPGYDEAAAERMPHAWKAGPQTMLLRRQLEAMEDGGLVVISAPANPFRCPPGPYERASLIAWFLKTRKPRSKLILLDAKDAFSKQKLFQNAWAELYPGLLEWVPLSAGGKLVSVDPAALTLTTDFDTYKPAVANVIPPQRAGRVAGLAGVADRSGWCPIDPATFASTLQPNIHVIGDAAIAGAMPKSAFAANAQAKVCAAAVAALLAGNSPGDWSTRFVFVQVGLAHRIVEGCAHGVGARNTREHDVRHQDAPGARLDQPCAGEQHEHAQGHQGIPASRIPRLVTARMNAEARIWGTSYKRTFANAVSTSVTATASAGASARTTTTPRPVAESEDASAKRALPDESGTLNERELPSGVFQRQALVHHRELVVRLLIVDRNPGGFEQQHQEQGSKARPARDVRFHRPGKRGAAQQGEQQRRLARAAKASSRLAAIPVNALRMSSAANISANLPSARSKTSATTSTIERGPPRSGTPAAKASDTPAAIPGAQTVSVATRSGNNASSPKASPGRGTAAGGAGAPLQARSEHFSSLP